jgi:beta-xylosidase
VSSAVTVSGTVIGTPQLIYDGNVPDPSILFVGDTFYVYSTDAGGANLPVMVSKDLIHWRRLGDAMAFLPTWAVDLSGFTWAPSVSVAPGGGYQAFFSSLDTNGQECIGRAIAPTPTGPFVDTSASPLVCAEHQGAIDPSLFRSATGDFLVWKADTGRNKLGEILAQRLTAADSELAAAPVVLLTASRVWEEGIVEGPSLSSIGGHLYLFFSAGRWDTNDYAIGLTSCSSPLEPCDESTARVVLSSRPDVFSGPGGPDVFSWQGHQRLVFSAWTGGSPGATGSRRALYMSVLNSSSVAASRASRVSMIRQSGLANSQ